MNAVDRFSSKAAFYTRFRWDYAAEAVQVVVTECGLSKNSVIADIGSGTGLLARHFINRVGTVLAVEPSPEMRAVSAIEGRGAYQIFDGFSDATTLPDNSVDMVTVGRALHWFPADSTRTELRRILKPGGWLAIFGVRCKDQALLDCLESVHTVEKGWEIEADKPRLNPVPLGFYFGHEDYRSVSLPGLVAETWDDFLGRISSFSGAPGPDHPFRAKFEKGLREVFERYAFEGVLNVRNATEATFGRVHGDFRRGNGA